MKKKISALLGAAALTLGGIALPTTAMAARHPLPPSSPVQEASPNLIQSDHKVELKIHKYLGKASTDPANNGKEVTGEKLAGLGTALNGVQFDVYKVQGVDLKTNQGWIDAAALVGKQTVTNEELKAKSITVNGSTHALGEATQVTTTGDGTATFAPETDGIGLYLVVENVKGSETITNAANNETVDKSKVTPSAPFFVTLPMTDPGNRDSWMYTVHVYPKNQADTLVKKVDDSKAYSPTAGDNEKVIRYLLDGDISDTGDADGSGTVDGADLGYWMLQDTLDPAHFDLSSVDLKVSIGTARPGTPLEEADWAKSVDETKGLVSVALTSAGLDKAAKANNDEPSTKIFVDLSVKLNANASLDTEALQNTGYLFPNGKWVTSGSPEPGQPTTPVTPPNPGDFTPPTPVDPNDPENPKPGIPSNTVSSKYGKIVLKKVNSDYEALEGATFALYHSGDNTTCEASDIQGKTPIATAKAVDGQAGVYTFDNILMSTSYTEVAENGEATTHTEAGNGHVYCIVETKAPEGYELLAEPVPFQLKAGAETVDIPTVAAALTKENPNSDNSIAVVNMPSNLGNRLPFTGAQGVMLAAGAGLALLFGGIVMGIRNRKDTVE